MKTLMIINSLDTGGAEKLIVDSVPLYQKRNVKMDVLLLKNKDTPFRKQLEVTTKGNVFGITQKSIYNPLLVFKIIPYLKNYQIIHCHLFPTLYWVVFAKVFSLSKTKIIFTEHSTTNKRRNHFVLSKVDKFVYAQLQFVGCISQGAFDSLKQYLNSSNKLRLISNGIELSSFKNLKVHFHKSVFFSEKSIVLIQVSSFRKQKDQETLIESLSFLPDEIKLLLVGEGALRTAREEQVIKLGLETRVKFLGNRNDVPQLLKYADIVVLSSHYEGFGLVVVEGMAAGKPVIASDVSGVREIVKDYGLLFKQGDSKDLSDKVLSLYNNDSYYNAIREKCIARAEHFDINNMVEKYIELYKQLI